MEKTITPEELLFDLDQIRIKYKGKGFDIEEGSPRIDESLSLINQFKESCIRDFAKWTQHYRGSSYVDYYSVEDYLNDKSGNHLKFNP